MSEAAPILFGICAANAVAQGYLLDSGVFRLFPSGSVEQGQSTPYATYATISGRAINSMDAPSRADNARIQIDAWHESRDAAATISQALRDALEDQATQSANNIGVRVVGLGPDDFDSEKRLFCVRFDVSFWTVGTDAIVPTPTDPARVYFTGDPLKLLAGQDLPARRIVVVRSGVMYLADPTVPTDAGEVVGITQDAVSNGSYGFVRTHGLMVDTSWNWVPGSIYYTTGGALTQTLPVAETAEVARAVNATQILVNIQSPG